MVLKEPIRGLAPVGSVRVFAKRLLARGTLGGRPGGGLLLGGFGRRGTLCKVLGAEGGGGGGGRRERRRGGGCLGAVVRGTRETGFLIWGCNGWVRELWREGAGVMRGIGGLGGGEERTGATVVKSVCA